jgi:hypothetical protein
MTGTYILLTTVSGTRDTNGRTIGRRLMMQCRWWNDIAITTGTTDRTHPNRLLLWWWLL